MRLSTIPTKSGTDTIKTYTISDFPYSEFKPVFFKKNGRGKTKTVYISQIFASFDIETSTIIPKDDRPYGFMYHWQLAIGYSKPVVVTGRYWAEFIEFLDLITDILEINEDHRLIIYIHNLSYEYQFMIDFLKSKWDCKIFATQERKPITLKCSNGLEFRCSYKLSNMSLQKATQNMKGVQHIKATGDLDYKKIRYPDTELDDTEFGYCVADVVSLWEYVYYAMRNEGDDLTTIPLTSTGYVRRLCRKSVRSDTYYRQDFLAARMTPKVYELLKEAGRGGDTHANRYLAGRHISNVDSYDAQSSYPYQLVTKKYPMTKFTSYGEITSQKEFDALINSKPCLFRALFTNIRLKADIAMPYISISKALAINKDRKNDNGRLLKTGADGYIILTLTDIDYRLIKKQYEWDDLYIADLHTSDYGYLPDALIRPIIDLYREKCLLKYEKERLEQILEKGNVSRETFNEYENICYLYAKSKNRLNAIFGMCYTDPLHPEIYLDADGKWDTRTINIEEGLDRYYKSRNSFLNYAWGIWTTCHAREHLALLIDTTGQTNTIYGDTDSSKAFDVDPLKIEAVNAEIRKICEERGAYADVGTVRYYMGIFEHENSEPIQDFITLGAKKYGYVDESGLHLTISGVNKKKGVKELGEIDNFKTGFIFREAGGNTLYYNDNVGIHQIELLDYKGVSHKFMTASNIGMTDSTYTIGLGKEYNQLLQEIGCFT